MRPDLKRGPRYNIRMCDGRLFPDEHGKPFVFISLAAAREWMMPGEQVVPGAPMADTIKVQEGGQSPA